MNCRFLTQRVTGVQRYALGCALNMQKIFGEEVGFVAPTGELDLQGKDLKNVEQFGHLQGHLWEQVDLPRYAKSIGVPVVLSFCGLPPILYPRYIYCIHDMAVFRHPEFFSILYGFYYRLMTRIAIKRASQIICVSEFTKSELKDILKVDGVKVVNNIVENSFATLEKNFSPRLSRFYNKKFLIAVGSLEPRKNLNRLIRAFIGQNFQDIHLLIIGDKGRAFADSATEQVEHRNVIFTGYVDDEDLDYMYRSAIGFVYPSIYEGFGIPPLEAMIRGCPVAASAVTSMPEVCGDAAIYFDPHDVESIGRAISKLVLDIQSRTNLISRGRARVSRYSSLNQQSQLSALTTSLEKQ